MDKQQLVTVLLCIGIVNWIAYASLLVMRAIGKRNEKKTLDRSQIDNQWMTTAFVVISYGVAAWIIALKSFNRPLLLILEGVFFLLLLGYLICEHGVFATVFKPQHSAKEMVYHGQRVLEIIVPKRKRRPMTIITEKNGKHQKYTVPNTLDFSEIKGLSFRKNVPAQTKDHIDVPSEQGGKLIPITSVQKNKPIDELNVGGYEQ